MKEKVCFVIGLEYGLGLKEKVRFSKHIDKCGGDGEVFSYDLNVDRD